MFDKNVFLRDTLRLVTAEIKRFEVDNRVEATDDDLANILKKMAKQRKDSIQQYACLLYTSPSPRDVEETRMPSSA